VAQYDPEVQARQTLNPADDAYVPAKHDVQTEAEAAEYFPATQLVMADRPVVAQNDPEVQARQTLNPADDAYVPAKHDVQTEAEAAAYFPAAQMPVTADSAVVAQYDPAEQGSHALNPVDAAK
jgi:hypothetical protein